MNRYIIMLLALVVGCSRPAPAPQAESKPKTPAEVRALAAKAMDDARSAREAKSPKDAANAARQAREASDLAKTLLPKTGATPAQLAACSETDALAREANRLADLADEDARLAEKLAWVKDKGYDAKCKAGLEIAFGALVDAAHNAKARGLQTPPRPVKQSSLVAAQLAGYYGRANLSGGAPDWDGVASDLDAMSANPPPAVRMILTLGFLIAAQDVLALNEVESIDPRLITRPEEEALYHLVRGRACSRNGLPALAVEQESLAAGERARTAVGPEWVGVVRLMLALDRLRRGETDAAEADLALARQAWPDDPLFAFVEGEKLAAAGEREKAAAAFEKEAALAKDGWLAKKLAARAGEVRVKKDKAAPLFDDMAFFCDVMNSCVADKARDKAPQSLTLVTAGAQWLGKKILELTALGM